MEALEGDSVGSGGAVGYLEAALDLMVRHHVRHVETSSGAPRFINRRSRTENRRAVENAKAEKREGRVLTFVQWPPDDQWPRLVLPAWPPYYAPVSAGALVYTRGSRGIDGAATVLPSLDSESDSDSSADEDKVTIVPLFGPRAGVPKVLARRKVELVRGRGRNRAVSNPNPPSNPRGSASL